MTPLFNLLKLSHFVPLSLVHNVVFPLSCESGGYLNRSVCTRVSPRSAQERGDQLLFTFLPPFMWQFGPQTLVGVATLLYFYQIICSFLFCDVHTFEHGLL